MRGLIEGARVLGYYRRNFLGIAYWVDYVYANGYSHFHPSYVTLHWFYFYCIHLLLGAAFLICWFGFFGYRGLRWVARGTLYVVFCSIDSVLNRVREKDTTRAYDCQEEKRVDTI